MKRLIALALVTGALASLTSIISTAPAQAGWSSKQGIDSTAQPITVAQRRTCSCRPYITLRGGVICRWAACGAINPGTHTSACGYRCPGHSGLIWRGSQSIP